MIYEITILIPYECNTLVDIFGGSGAITINRTPRLSQAILNDVNSEIANMHMVMADAAMRKEFIHKLNLTTYSENFFNIAMQHQNSNYEGLSEVDKAIQTFILLTQSFNSSMKSYRKPKTAESLKIMQERYRKKIEYDLPCVADKYKGVTILNEDGIDLIDRYRNDENVIIAADPPYLERTRSPYATKAYGKKGKYEFKEKDHMRLLETLKEVKCKAILFGYADPLYDNILATSTSNIWIKFLLKKVINLASREKYEAEEVVWINFEPNEKAKREIEGLRKGYQITKN